MTEVGNVYGQSLYELAKDEGLSREIGEQLTVLQKSFGEEPDFIRLLSNPSLSKPERCRILDTSFRGSVHPYILNFMKILTERGYIRHFSDCCDAFSELYNRDNGILKGDGRHRRSSHPGAGGKAHRKAEPDHRKDDRAPQSH